MKNLLISIDIFGYPPSFSILKQPFHLTVFGGILSAILIIIGFITLIFFSLPLFEKDSPSVNLSTENLPNPPKINYFNNFELLLGIQNNNYITEINEKIFQAEGLLFRTIVNESGIYNIKTSIDLTSCDKALDSSKNKELFANLNLKGYYCISPEQKNEIFIQEHWGHNDFYMIQIKFVDCDNSTGNCATEEEVYDFLHSADLSFYIVDNLVSTKNYKEPFKRKLKEQSLKVSEQYKVSLIQYIKHLRIENDDNIVLRSNHSMNSFTLGDFVSNTVFDRDSDTFLSLSIQLDNTIEKFQRKYYKIQDVAAQVGGIINASYMVISFILKLYEKNSYFEFMLNNFFEVRLDEFQKQIKLKSYNKGHIQSHRKTSSLESGKSSNLNSKVNTETKSSPSNSNGNELNNTLIQIERKGTSRENKKIKFSFFDKLILLKIAPKFSRAKKEKVDEIFFKGSEYIMEHLDIINHLRRAHASDMKSDLLMGEEQKKIFQYITKPILSLSFLGTRYNIHNLPVKVKNKLLNKNTIFEKNLNDKFFNLSDDDSPEKPEKKKKLKNHKKEKIVNEDNDEE